MCWKEFWTYTNVGGIYQYREVWEMVGIEDENEFMCTKCDCRVKTTTSSKYHFNTTQTPTGRDFLKAQLTATFFLLISRLRIPCQK